MDKVTKSGMVKSGKFWSLCHCHFVHFLKITGLNGQSGIKRQAGPLPPYVPLDCSMYQHTNQDLIWCSMNY